VAGNGGKLGARRQDCHLNLLLASNCGFSYPQKRSNNGKRKTMLAAVKRDQGGANVCVDSSDMKLKLVGVESELIRNKYMRVCATKQS